MMRDSCQLIVSRNFGADIDNFKVPPIPPCKEGPSKGPHPAKFPLVYVDIFSYLHFETFTGVGSLCQTTKNFIEPFAKRRRRHFK